MNNKKESDANYFRPCSSHGMMVLSVGEIIKSHHITWSDYYYVWYRVTKKEIGRKYDPTKHGVVIKPFQAVVVIK